MGEVKTHSGKPGQRLGRAGSGVEVGGGTGVREPASSPAPSLVTRDLFIHLGLAFWSLISGWTRHCPKDQKMCVCVCTHVHVCGYVHTPGKRPGYLQQIPPGVQH